ncbi:proteoglycan 4-like [Acanthaster planci]|uniref:Proteoglycan 4-like n=1 Tax=Acanthaster planci TaxID=133434 RepID=A0A8B8A2T7_ACAPL|nr:proteoglycan 4-like [Acanthaster planci]
MLLESTHDEIYSLTALNRFWIPQVTEVPLDVVRRGGITFLKMSVTVPFNISTQIGPYPIIYNTPRSMEPKTPPKPLPKRKPGHQSKHIYDRVPLEGSLFKKSYSPVMYPKKLTPAPPGKLVPNLLNILTINTQREGSETSVENPISAAPDKPALVPPEEGITSLASSPTQGMQSENKPTPPIKNKAKRQGCPNLEEEVGPEPFPHAEKHKDGDTKHLPSQEESPGCEEEVAAEKKNAYHESAKCEEVDGSISSQLENSISKEQDTESIKADSGSLFSSTLRSTTCSASSACSSSSSSSSASSTSSNTSSESSNSSIAKAFFNTPHLGSSTPKRINSPKNYTPVENLYDSWRLDIAAKSEGTTPPANAVDPVQRPKKCSGYYAEISDYMSTAALGSSRNPTENQAVVLPPPLQFCNSHRKVKEKVLYVNLPAHVTNITSQTTEHAVEDQQVDTIIVNGYADPQDELMNESRGYENGSLSAYTKIEDGANPYETPLDMATAATQTEQEVVTVSCECGEFLCLPAEMEEIVAQLKHEQNMRMVSEQLVKMVEVEIKELKEDLLAKKTDLVRALEEKQSAQGELREATKIAAQYKIQIDELEKDLTQAKAEIAKLEERVAIDSNQDSRANVNGKQWKQNCLVPVPGALRRTTGTRNWLAAAAARVRLR